MNDLGGSGRAALSLAKMVTVSTAATTDDMNECDPENHEA